MLTKSDYGEIEVAVRKMLNTSSSQPQLQTSLGHIVSVTGTPDQTVTRWDQIRAGYAPGSNRITLPGLLLGPADNSPQCRAHLIACVAHELRHNFQDIGEQRGGEILQAVGLNRIYIAAPTPDNYCAYIGHSIETEAHGTMIAAEIVALGVPVSQLRQTSLFQYCAGKLAGAGNETSVLNALEAEAIVAHHEMTR